MGVCLYVGFGCDEFFLTEACAKSSNTTEGGAQNGTLNYDWDGKRQSVSSTMEQSLDGVGCVGVGCCLKLSQCAPMAHGEAGMRPPHNTTFTSRFCLHPAAPVVDQRRVAFTCASSWVIVVMFSPETLCKGAERSPNQQHLSKSNKRRFLTKLHIFFVVLVSIICVVY